MLVREVNEFLGHLLFKIKSRVEALQRADRFLESFEPLGVFATAVASNLRVLLTDRVALLLNLLAKTWQHFHVALTALDLLIENYPIETLTALGKFFGQLEVSAGDKAEPVHALLHHVLGFFDPLGYLHLLLAGQKRNLTHLLEIHPHRVVQNIEL